MKIIQILRKSTTCK